MSSTLPTLNYTTPEEFVNYYYEKLKTDLQVYDLQISKVGFVGFFLNLLGYTHFDLKQYYDSLFKEAFVGTSQTEESQFLQAAIYGYIPSFANPATAVGTIEFDMLNWLPRKSADVVKREVTLGYDKTEKIGFYINDVYFSIDASYKFVEATVAGLQYYYVDIITKDGQKLTIPFSGSTISIPLYSTTQYVKKEIEFELAPYNFGSFQTYYFGVDVGYYLSDLEVYITEVGSTVEEKFDVVYTKYLSKGDDSTVFLRKITSVGYVLEFGSGIRGKWVSGASVRLLIKSTQGSYGNLIDKTNTKIQLSGLSHLFDYTYGLDGNLSPISGELDIERQPLINFEYAEGGINPLSGEDLRDAIVNFIQTRDNLMSQQDFYNLAKDYFNDFKFLFKKFNIFDNIFYLCRSFRDRNQSIFYTTNYTDPIMNLSITSSSSYHPIVAAGTVGTLISGTYGYFIVSVDEWGRSKPSEIASITIDNGLGQNSVTITWAHVPYATKYRIYGRNLTLFDQYWEVEPLVPAATYSYIDDGTNGTPEITPTSYVLQEIYYNPTFEIDGTTFISPFVYKGNTRMGYYDGYLMKDLSRIEFSEVTIASDMMNSGLDIPVTYLNLEYDEVGYITTIKLMSPQTISNLVFTISIFGSSLNISNKSILCYPFTNNYFEYQYTNSDTFGIFEGELQIEVTGGVSDSVLSHNCEDFTIVAGVSDILKIKFNDSSVGCVDSFITVTLTAGVVSVAQIVSDINIAIGSTVASTYAADSGIKLKITPPSGGVVSNVFIGDAAAGSTCLDILGLIGNPINIPAILNGPMTSERFTSRTNKFYQILDISDQLKLMRYNVGSETYILNVPVISKTVFDSDTGYYLDKIKNFISASGFEENRMVTDNVQCRFLDSYKIESPFIESIFLQSGTIFSNPDYNFLSSVIDTRDTPPLVVSDGSHFRVSTTPAAVPFIGHANDIAIYTAGACTFYSPVLNDFVLDLAMNVYYMWDGTSWVDIPDIILPLNIRLEVRVDKNYVQKNNIDLSKEIENLELVVAEYLQKGFTGASVIFYNSLIIEFVHTNRPFIKSVKVYVTDSSAVPNQLNNGIEIKSDDDIFRGLKSKLDIVKYGPPIIYWNVDDIDINVLIE